MDEFSEQEVLEILSELENSGVINKISAEEYIYFPNEKAKPHASNRLYKLNIEKRKDLTILKHCFQRKKSKKFTKMQHQMPNAELLNIIRF